MKTIGTVLLVLVAVMGMAMPVLGAEAGSSAGAYADWDIATQYSNAWAMTGDGDEYAGAGTNGASLGETDSSSGAGASDWDNYAAAGTQGYCVGIICDTTSAANAIENDEDGQTNAGADSNAEGIIVEVDSGAESFWGPPIYSNAGAYGYSVGGWADSSAGANAYVP